MLLVLHARGGTIDIDVTDVEPAGNVSRQAIITEHRDVAEDRLMVTGQLAFRHDERAIGIRCGQGAGWLHLVNSFDQQVTLCV